MKLSQDMIDELISLAESRCDSDCSDFSPFDYEDGPDDAWDGGKKTGEVELARCVLDSIGVSYELPESEDE